MALFVIASTESPTLLRDIATGCWYHDAYRIAANTVIFSIPLAGLGINALYEVALHTTKHKTLVQSHKTICFVCIFTVCLLMNFLPVHNNYLGGKAFIETTDTIKLSYSLDPEVNILTEEEVDFAKQVRNITGDNAVIINVPDDGSVFLYGTENLNLLYTRIRIWDPTTEDQATSIIRTSLSSIKTNESVQDAVAETEAQYVLLLDQSATGNDPGYWLFTWRWYSTWWDGITSITDNTPGFELVLSEGDMRLYRIIA
jgi:hypothetical protein